VIIFKSNDNELDSLAVSEVSFYANESSFARDQLIWIDDDWGELISNTPKNWLLVALLEQGGVPVSADFHFTTS